MATKPILYGTYTSPGVNAVRITLKTLGVEYDFCEVRPMQGENNSPEYLRKNPTGTIPAFETENGEFIGDSHAIVAYVVDRYAKDDSLYPRDLYARAKVQQLQHFADSWLFALCVKPAFAPIFARLSTTVPENILKDFDRAYAILERFLGDHKWIAADHVTIADFNCITCLYGMFYLHPFTADTHPLLSDWFNRMMSDSNVYDTIMSGSAMTSSLSFLNKTVSKL
ncbi:glutathione S-transferase 1-like [Haematobia irritans]|uniref:glutathione S-transferase 1-like n=1 Tax=Haematobia irritans TaxID=7368 RepID=UPI003F505212